MHTTTAARAHAHAYTTNTIGDTGMTGTDTAAPAGAPRVDLYTAIHKALRAFMLDTLQRVGSMDASDTLDRQQTLDQVDALLLQLASHVQHENEYVHTAIEARCAGGASHTASDHVGHLEALLNLQDQAAALRQCRAEQRPVLGLALYRQLALFIGENLAHMHVEESQNNAALWALYSDAELAALHERLMASVPPAEMALCLRWMVVALNVQELAGLFGSVQGQVPPPVWDAWLDIARTHMPAARYATLARALGLAAVPGLVAA